MKIIHIITAFGFGGAERLLLEVANRQVINNDVHIVYLKKVEGLLPLLDIRVKTYHINLTFRITRDLKMLLNKLNPDIVHTHLGHADMLGIWSSRNINAKIFCTMHNIYFQRNWLDPIFFKIYQLLFNRISKDIVVISISKCVENHVLNTLKVPNERSFVLYNAIPPNESLMNNDLHKNKTFKKDQTTLLFVGRLAKQKSVHTLLNAIKIIKERGYENVFRLIIVGDGDLRNSLENLSKELQIENLVKFEGEKTNVEDYFSISDIFILPSIWEGFGIVILEAFRSKLAVIASNIEGPSELITDNVNGLLFKPNDAIELANKIILLIDDKNFRKSIAEQGYLSFNEKFHIEEYINKLMNLYGSD